MQTRSVTVEFAKDFRGDRLAKLDSGDIAVSLAKAPLTAMHLYPGSAAEPGASVDLSLATKHRNLTGLTGDHWSLSYDFDGLLSWESSDPDETTSYVQVFRSGAVEIADTFLLSSGSDGGKPDIRVFERAIVEATRNWTLLLKEIGAAGPLAIMLTLTDVHDWSIEGGETGDSRLTPRPIDRDDLVIAESFLDDIAADPARAMKSVFDPIWNAAGYPGSPSFSSDGGWRGL